LIAAKAAPKNSTYNSTYIRVSRNKKAPTSLQKSGQITLIKSEQCPLRGDNAVGISPEAMSGVSENSFPLQRIFLS
jgi:hypothetical protein